MITINEIHKLKNELEENGFDCAYYESKLEVYVERELIMTIDFSKRAIEFGAHPKNVKGYPRFSYLMGRIYGMLW